MKIKTDYIIIYLKISKKSKLEIVNREIKIVHIIFRVSLKNFKENILFSIGEKIRIL